MNRANLISHAATILPVLDVMASATYYRDKLGFDITFTWGKPVDYAVLNREEAVSIHFSKRSEDTPVPKKHIAIYVFTHDVDQLYEEFQTKGARISTPIGDREYGMRDFDVEDPDGYLLSFGQNMERSGTD